MIGLAIAGGVVLLVFLIFVLPGFAMIGANEVGVLTKKMSGKKLPDGQIIARNGEVGVQAEVLMPGFYWWFPLVWKISKVPVVDINTNEVGVVESIDGEQIPKGRLLGDEVECNTFQDAKAFLNGSGKKGPQVAILRPGTYRINTKVFTITKKPVTRITKEEIGIVVALDGVPLPPGYIVAPKPPEQVGSECPKARPHKFFQDGQAFIDSMGYRGPQLDTLQPGEYYINPVLFTVKSEDVVEVPPGYVAVLRSNVGKELEKKTDAPTDVPKEPDLKQPIHEAIETLLIPDRNTRGIWKEPVAPGKYNLNRIAFTAYLVPTSAVTIDWASGTEVRSEIVGAKPKSRPAVEERPESEKATEFFKFSQLRVTSKDGFQLDVDVRMVIRIKPDNAAFIIARFGSVDNLIEQIVHPLIDSSFRNKAGEEKAIEFIQGRTKLQKDALEKARIEFSNYSVEAQNLLIAYIAVDKSLLDTQTNKEIALQQQEQFKEQAKAEEERIQVEERKARAEKQKDVVSAMLSINIKQNQAEAVRKEAEGVRDAAKIKADGEAEAIRKVGEATAQAYKAQADVVGPEKLAVIQVVKEVGEKGIKITPEVLVTGGGDNSGGSNLFNAWLATTIKKDEKKSEVTEEKK